MPDRTPINPYSAGTSGSMPANGTAPVETSPEEIEYLRAQAALAESALRRAALLASGVDLDSKAGQFFAKHLDKVIGDRLPTSAEDVRATARAYGVPLRDAAW